jgi:CBS domain-containing protein
MLRSVSLRDYMLRDPATTHSDAPIPEALGLIVEHRISGLCVIDDERRLVGILSELDCLRAMLDAVNAEADPGRVADVMAKDNLVVAHPDEDIVDVAQDMLIKNKRRRPVVEDGRLVGQVTCRQLLQAMSQLQRTP